MNKEPKIMNISLSKIKEFTNGLQTEPDELTLSVAVSFYGADLHNLIERLRNVSDITKDEALITIVDILDLQRFYSEDEMKLSKFKEISLGDFNETENDEEIKENIDDVE